MAIRQKTVKYAFPMRTTSLAAATRNDFAAETLYIPETASRTFKSVRIDVWARQTDVAATSLTSWLMGIKLAAVAYSDVTVTDTITNSGEHTQWHFSRDVTSYFTTNFGAGASQTCQVGVQFGAVATINIVVELTITYEFDDASASTRVKTVEIPLDSNTGLLTNALVEMGTNQIPQLTGGGLLPEASPVIRDWYIKVIGNEKAQGGTTDFALGLQIDSDAEYLEGNRESALATSCSFVSIYSRKSAVPTTTAAHALKARGTVTSRFHFAAVLVVTYEYDHASSTQILNSIRVPMTSALNDQVPHANASGDKHTYAKDVWIEEPGTPTLRQSGLVLLVSPGTYGSTFNLNVAAGAGSNRAYSIVRTSDVPAGAGDFLSHRIDSGGAGGAALTLARGRNALEVDLYHDAGLVGAGAPTLGHVVLLLNYVSDKHTDGDGVHNHTVEYVLQGTPAGAGVRFYDVTMPAFDPPGVGYFINALGLATHTMVSVFGGGCRVPWAAEFDNGEGPGTGWWPLQSTMSPGAGELGWTPTLPDVTHAFRLWSGDVRAERMSPETSRLFRWALINGTNLDFWVDAHILVTYHSIKWQRTFTARDYPSGDGSGLPVTLHRDDTGETILAGATVAGGACTFIWFDDTVRVWAETRHGAEPSAYRGRSAAVRMSD